MLSPTLKIYCPQTVEYQILSPTLKIYCPQTVERQILSPTLKIYCPQTAKRQMLTNTLRILFCPKTKYNHALPLKKNQHFPFFIFQLLFFLVLSVACFPSFMISSSFFFFYSSKCSASLLFLAAPFVHIGGSSLCYHC